MRIRRVVVKQLLLAITVAGVAHAHVGDFPYLIYKLAPGSVDVHDGSVADWEEAVPGPSMVTGDFYEYLGGTAGVAVAPEDIAFRVFLGWSEEEQRIYVGIERFDDSYINGYDGVNYLSYMAADHVQFFVDGDHSGGQYSDYGDYPATDPSAGWEQKRIDNSPAQFYMVVPEAPIGNGLFMFNAGYRWVTDEPWSSVGGAVVGVEQGTSVVEFAITPWDDLDWEDAAGSSRSHLAAGGIIGLMFAVYDIDDEGPDQAGLYYLTDYISWPKRIGSWIWAHADGFADGYLCGDGPCVPGVPSAIESVTWGRIKASLQ